MTASLPLLATTLQTVPDTVVTVVARDGLQTASDIALVVLGVFLVVLLLVLVVLLLQLRKLDGTVRALGNKALDKADPILERGKGVADNVEFISAAVRTDVERLSRTVRSLTERLQQASDHMEERIEEFNALMEVVQDEAEDIFIGTAATARGVREGVRTLHGGGAGRSDAGSEGERPGVHGEDEVFLTGGGEDGGSDDGAEPVPPPERTVAVETAGEGPDGEASR